MTLTAELLSLIEKADVITIYGHAMPDGYCYGCQVGLRELIRFNYPKKKVYAVGSGLPILFDEIAPMDEVDEKTIASSLAILVDVSCLRRVEDPRVYKAKTWIKFDHHCLNPGLEPFTWPCIVKEGTIAAAEIIIDFAKECGWKFNKIAATCLFLALATDSGRFQFYGTTEHTLALAEEMKSYGVDPDRLYDIVYAEDDTTKAYKQWMRESAIHDGNVTYLVVSRRQYHERGLPYEKASEYVNALCGLNGTPIFALFCEDEHGYYRVELRSNRKFPVQPVAKQFGGGGHRYAAGAELRHDGTNYLDVIHALNQVEEDP